MKNNRYDSLGNRMKAIENIETSQMFSPNSWIYVRIDGRCFSKFTKGLNRPFDENFSNLMVETTKYLSKEYNSILSYTQSDEISLALFNDYESPIIFNGEKQKLISSIASSASAFFNSKLSEYLPQKAHLLATFDTRIIQMPSQTEISNMFLWRFLDAQKNSISMAAREYFSHKSLHKKSSKEMIDMLLVHYNISFNSYFDNRFRSGVFVNKQFYLKDGVTKRSHFTSFEMDYRSLPHEKKLEYFVKKS